MVVEIERCFVSVLINLHFPGNEKSLHEEAYCFSRVQTKGRCFLISTCCAKLFQRLYLFFIPFYLNRLEAQKIKQSHLQKANNSTNNLTFP